jgi:hypothetical protein
MDSIGAPERDQDFFAVFSGRIERYARDGRDFSRIVDGVAEIPKAVPESIIINQDVCYRG